MPKRKTAKALTHVDESGRLRMVDVGAKPVTAREAIASGFIRVDAPTRRLVRAGQVKKGNAIEAARLAGIMAAKRTADLIPLCHSLALTHVAVDIEPTARRLRDPRDRADERADRRRDGGAHGRRRRRAHPLRHAEGVRQADGDRRDPARSEDRRAVGFVAAPVTRNDGDAERGAEVPRAEKLVIVTAELSRRAAWLVASMRPVCALHARGRASGAARAAARASVRRCGRGARATSGPAPSR